MTIDTAIEILTYRRTCIECVRGNGSCEDCDHAFDMAINSLAERKTMTHEETVGFLQESGWLQDHDRQIYEQGKRDGIEERKEGFWDVYTDCEGKRTYYTCPFCKNKTNHFMYEPKYCDKCGARLKIEGSD